MAVVGPNGCGKTNIVDAVRWVLGEQRTTLLRAERMESVIFNGTAKRKPLGMAEVTLTIENTNGKLPTQYSEIELTRRLFRSGESEYLINRTPSRLRDIMDLFMDTGFGLGAYSIIELSMVEGIISGPSNARRVLIEEAAGVSHYKSRRTSAERRLESTREALLRLKDVYNEVEKNYNTLKRQAARAKRALNLQYALKLFIIHELGQERLNLNSRNQEITTQLNTLTEQIQKIEQDIVNTTSQMLSLEANELTLNNRISKTLELLKQIERREAECEGETALVIQRIEHLNSELARIDSAREEQESNALNYDKIITDTSSEIEKIQIRKSQLEELNHQQSQAYAQFDQELLSARERYSELSRRIADNESKFKQTQQLAQLTIERYNRLKNEHQSISARKFESETAIQKLQDELKSAHIKLDELKQQKKRADTEYTKLESEFELAKQQSVNLNRQEAEASVHFETLRADLNSHLKRGEAYKSLPQPIQHYIEQHNLRYLAELIICPEEYRGLIVAALREVLRSIDADDTTLALDLASNIDRNASTILRLINSKKSRFIKPNLPAEFQQCFWCDSIIENTGELGEFLKARLSRFLVVPDHQDIPLLQKWASEHNVYILTLNGWRLEPDGVLLIGGGDPESYRLGWKTRLEQLQQEVKLTEANKLKIENEADKARAQLLSLEQSLFNARQNYLNISAQISTIERNINDLDSELANNKHRAENLKSEASRIENELKALESEITNIQSSRTSESGIEDLIAERNKLSELIKNTEAERNNLNSLRLSNVAELARLNEKLSQLQQTQERAKFDKEKTHNVLAFLSAQKAKLDVDIKRAEQALESLKGQKLLINKEKNDLLKRLELEKSQRNALRNERERLVSKLKDLQEVQKSTSQKHNAYELELTTIRERLREIDRRLTEEGGITIESLSSTVIEEAQNELNSLELSDLSYEHLKLRLQSIGPVNMLALEELKPVEERYRFLTDQKKDLESGLELLTETIDRINMEVKRRIRETFEQVNINFQNLFRTLFDGGEARLLLEGDDPLEADIKIIATPSGKKLQNLSILSGGEKALTAIALLFAIYQVRPTPFCILDEVDAPLDDANVVRFNKMLRNFAHETQFLIITHNKRTMETADCLFGVTLDENGVSQLVSVKLNANSN